MTDKERETKLRRKLDEQAAYRALIKYYPLTLDDLPGEQWFDLGYDAHFISTFGRVKSFYWGRNPRILRPAATGDGYLLVSLAKGKVARIHRLVAEAFIPNPHNLLQVNHIDGHPLNNHVSNLEWVTASENTRHADKLGLRHPPEGTAHHAAKFSDEQIAAIRTECILGDSQRGITALARKYGVSQETIYRIVHGQSYGTCDEPQRVFTTNAKVNEEQRQYIRDVYSPRHPEFGCKVLAKRFGVCARTISEIINGH